MNSELANLDNVSRHYDNIIIISHCRDELVFFLDFITHRTLLVLVTKPSSSQEFQIINNFIIKKGCELVILEEPDTFNITFKLSDKTKSIIKLFCEYKSYNKLITQDRTTVESDVVSREVFDFVHSLKLNNKQLIKKHYVPEYDVKNKKVIPQGFYNSAVKYAQVYLNTDKEINNRVNMMMNTYSSVTGLKLIN